MRVKLAGRTAKHSLAICFSVLLSVSLPCVSPGYEDSQKATGHLLIIGGGLRPDNAEVYQRLIYLAGGAEKARVGVLPTAVTHVVLANRAAAALAKNGLPSTRAIVLDLTAANAATQAADPAIANQIRSCTGLLIAGGDQVVLVEALRKKDGTESPALKALYEVFQRGGVIAGTSAGAAVMSGPMIGSGDPLDALDFGVFDAPGHRGVFLTRGFGLFRAGLIDQHFNTYNGRLGRLARVLLEKRIALGFGIDEDTALDVQDTRAEVCGRGNVIVVDSSKGVCEAGPQGVRIRGLSLSLVGRGDVLNLERPGSCTIAIGSAKKAIQPGHESGSANRMITDLAQDNAVSRAMTAGLVDNASPSQSALLLHVEGNQGHGYRFLFSKGPSTKGYFGYVDGVPSYAAEGVELAIDPVRCTIEPAAAASPAERSAARRKGPVSADGGKQPSSRP